MVCNRWNTRLNSWRVFFIIDYANRYKSSSRLWITKCYEAFCRIHCCWFRFVCMLNCVQITRNVFFFLSQYGYTKMRFRVSVFQILHMRALNKLPYTTQSTTKMFLNCLFNSFGLVEPQKTTTYFPYLDCLKLFFSQKHTSKILCKTLFYSKNKYCFITGFWLKLN